MATRDAKGLTPPPKRKPWNAGIISLGAQSQPSRNPAPRIFDTRARAHHPAAAVEGVERGEVLALEAQLAVGVVLEDQRVVLVGQVDQLPAPRAGSAMGPDGFWKFTIV